MRKSYSRIVFGPDDTSIGSPEVEVEVEVPEIEVELPDTSLQDDMDELFEDAVEKPLVEDEPEVEVEVGESEVEVEIAPEVEPEINLEVEVPTDELSKAQALILQLQAQINELATPAPIVPVADTLTPAPSTDQINLTELFKDRDVSDLFETKEGFIGFMQEIVTHTQQATLAQFQREAPTMINSTVQSQNSMAEVKNAFYTDNADLVPVGQYVAKVASSLSEANPTWTVQEVLTQAAVDSRKALGITKPEAPTATSAKKTPALPGATSRGKGKPTPTNTLADEMDDLFSDI